MTMVTYWTNENAPNGGTSSQIHPNTCSTEERSKRKKLILKKKFTEAILFVGPEFRAKKIEKYFFLIFTFFMSIFHIYSKSLET